MPGKRGQVKTKPVGWLRCDEIALARLYPSEPDWLLARVFGRSESSVIGKAANMGLHKSAQYHAEHSARFKPGLVPWNRGTRRPGFAPGNMAATQFKKGRPAHEARNYVPIGTLRVDVDGYLQRKITDDPTLVPARRWVAEHRLVWEKANGPTPSGHVVVFRPGRKTADPALITLDAVELISRRELMARNTVHNLPEPLVQLVRLRGVLNRQINKRSKSE